MQICILNFCMEILNDMIFYIFEIFDRMQQTKRCFCIFYRLLEIIKKYSTNSFKKKIQTKLKDNLFLPDRVDLGGLTRPCRLIST